MPRSTKKKTVNLALQGGGAHGAFTWGVLDRLFEEPGVVIEGISGTSAGAMNGAMAVVGYEKDGPDGARAMLDQFWHKVADMGRFGPVHRMPWDGLAAENPWNLDYSLSFLMFDQMTRALSPYTFNPLNLNPLRVVLEDVLEIGQLRQCRQIKLFVTATNVRTGKAKVSTPKRCRSTRCWHRLACPLSSKPW